MRRLGVIVIVALLLAACGGSSDQPDATATATDSEVTVTSGSTPSPTADVTATSGTGATTATSGGAASPAPDATATVTSTSPATATSAPTPSPTPDTPPEAELTCGQEITESVTLANDMQCDPIALIVSGDNVVLDLGGHTISGPGPYQRAWPLPNFNVAGVIVHGDNVTVRNGMIDTTGLGLLAEGASGGRFTGLRTVGNYYGIYLYEGGGHTVEGNAVRENVYGLHLQTSHGNTLLGNDLSLQTHQSPGGYGLYLYSSDDNLIEGNTVQENLNWGLWFSDSTSNTIVHNNIIGNNPQVSDDTGGNTYYDAETREGNYWADYQGGDANSDGVGDVPYSIGGPGRSADPYPFLSQDGWSSRTTGTLADPTPPPPSGSPPRLYVMLDEGVAAINPESGTVLDTWDIALMGTSLATSPDGTRLYGISGDAAEASNVVAIDTETGEVVERWEVPGALVVATTYDGERVLVSTPDGLTEIVLDTGELRRQQAGANAVAITPTWKHNVTLVTDVNWMVHVVYLPNQHAVYSFKLPGKPLQVIDNRNGTRLFALIDTRDSISVIDVEQYIETDSVSLHGIAPENARIAPSPDGTTLYVLDRANSRIIAIDLGTKQITADLTLDGSAIDLAVTGNGEWVGVVLGGTNRMALFDRELGARGSVDIAGEPSALIAPR